jgi:hypothetical protein
MYGPTAWSAKIRSGSFPAQANVDIVRTFARSAAMIDCKSLGNGEASDGCRNKKPGTGSMFLMETLLC